MDTKLLAVYGTLREGQGNCTLFLSGVELVERSSLVQGFRMATFGGFPAIFHSEIEVSAVVVDVFDLNSAVNPEELLSSIDSMEFGVGYEREVVSTVTGREVMIYTMSEDQADFFPEAIPTGDWNDYEDGRYA